jgi:diacylglycerol kinase family enzyme
VITLAPVPLPLGPWLAVSLVAQTVQPEMVSIVKVSAVINKYAGEVDELHLTQRLKEALFRCELTTKAPNTFEEMDQFLIDEIQSGTDAIVVCGGDGTINRCLQPIMKLKESGVPVPPLCIVSSGTANDLATELGVSRRIERAAREIFEGQTRKIDVVKIASKTPSATQQAYMLTNGGIGLAERVASNVNQKKKSLRDLANRGSNDFVKTLGALGLVAMQKLKSNVYQLLFLESLLKYDFSGWDIQVESEDRAPLRTHSSVILVNNQSRIGKHFVPAPFTANNDGRFDVTVIDETRRLQVFLAVLEFTKGREARRNCTHIETRSVSIKSLNPERTFNFFGDGEVLLEDISECQITCIAPGLEIFGKGDLQ